MQILFILFVIELLSDFYAANKVMTYSLMRRIPNGLLNADKFDIKN